MDRFGIIIDERLWQALLCEAVHPDMGAIKLRDAFVRDTRGDCWKQDGDTATLVIPDETQPLPHAGERQSSCASQEDDCPGKCDVC